MKRVDLILQQIRLRKASEHIVAGAHVLDIGCGEGELFKFLKGRIGPSTGIDEHVSATREADGHQILRGNFPADLSISSRFDVITMLAVIEHLPDPALKSLGMKCYDLLDDKGVVVITVPSPLVDRILVLLRFLRLVDAETLHQHHGFVPGCIPGLFPPDLFVIEREESFEFGLNNLFVIRKRARFKPDGR